MSKKVGNAMGALCSTESISLAQPCHKCVFTPMAMASSPQPSQVNSNSPTMLFRLWAHLLSLSVWHHLAGVRAGAIDEPRDHETYESHLSDQEVFSGLCPDYTTYARHMQCVTSISHSSILADM